MAVFGVLCSLADTDWHFGGVNSCHHHGGSLPDYTVRHSDRLPSSHPSPLEHQISHNMIHISWECDNVSDGYI